MFKFRLSLLLILFSNVLFAREGMWIPTLLDKYNIEEMQQMGFRLTADDIYSINENSLKDAVVLFGGGCTGEMVSSEGLLFTNYHCGYSNIQSHSSVENDYLTDGFWAMSKEEELPNPRLTVSFLEYMQDVTDSVMAGTDNLSGDELSDKIDENIDRIEEFHSNDGKYSAVVKPLFYGNQYFVYVYKIYKDVRLVGAPPSAIGKFGGDTDNWMWPRQTGDFSIFRVYADENNEPAEYSEDNVPYHPKSYLPLSLKGVSQNDPVMLLGYPGSTQEYLPSEAVEMIMDQSDPDLVKIRTEKLDILSKHMDSDPKVRIQYATKYANTSNSWKRWQGEIKGLERMDALEIKTVFENDFRDWYSQNDSLENLYSDILPRFQELYAELQDYNRAYNYYTEIVSRGTDILSLTNIFSQVIRGWDQLNDERKQGIRERLISEVENHFKNYDQPTDEEVFAALMRMLDDDLYSGFLPEYFKDLMQSYDDEKLLKKVYQKSVFTDMNKLIDLAENMNSSRLRKLSKDPVMRLYENLRGFTQQNIYPVYNGLNDDIDNLQNRYMRGIMSMKKDEVLYPDANLTMRVAYGKVGGYHPKDAVTYKYYTTLGGVIEKDDPTIYDYNVPQKLKDLYEEKDFGNYDSNGEMPVAFIASIHTTGGNSGSPAINADGELLGLNFDRCWEGTMSDIMFDPDMCRNIMVDIRYVLFLIDKFAGAGYLLDEMEIKN